MKKNNACATNAHMIALDNSHHMYMICFSLFVVALWLSSFIAIISEYFFFIIIIILFCSFPCFQYSSFYAYRISSQ